MDWKASEWEASMQSHSDSERVGRIHAIGSTVCSNQWALRPWSSLAFSMIVLILCALAARVLNILNILSSQE
eukprot:scaffold16322_cov21-Tisochrysis_lutea.AAC.1